MITFVYVIYDKISEEHSPPDISKNDGVALRKYQDYTKKLGDINKTDFTLHCIGKYDTASGRIIELDKREVKKTGVENEKPI